MVIGGMQVEGTSFVVLESSRFCVVDIVSSMVDCFVVIGKIGLVDGNMVDLDSDGIRW